MRAPKFDLGIVKKLQTPVAPTVRGEFKRFRWSALSSVFVSNADENNSYNFARSRGTERRQKVKRGALDKSFRRTYLFLSENLNVINLSLDSPAIIIYTAIHY